MPSNRTAKRLRLTLLWLGGFIGVGAYWGALMMFIDPTGDMWGMDAILPRMQVLPFAQVLFHNFVVSGVALMVVNGWSNTIAFALLKRNSIWGAWADLLCGVLLLMWLSVQWIIFDINTLTTLYTLFAVVQIFLSLRLMRSHHALIRRAVF